MGKTKDEFTVEGDKFKSYNFIKENYKTYEEFDLYSVIKTMKDNFDIDCDMSEAELIVDEAKEFASYSDKFKIEKYRINGKIYYKIVNLEKSH